MFDLFRATSDIASLGSLELDLDGGTFQGYF